MLQCRARARPSRASAAGRAVGLGTVLLLRLRLLCRRLRLLLRCCLLLMLILLLLILGAEATHNMVTCSQLACQPEGVANPSSTMPEEEEKEAARLLHGKPGKAACPEEGILRALLCILSVLALGFLTQEGQSSASSSPPSTH